MCILLLKLVNYGDDKTYSFEYSIEEEPELKGIDYRDLNLNIYHSIYKVDQNGYS